MKPNVKFIAIFLLLLLTGLAFAAPESMQPKKIKSRGKPRVAKWQDVDATLAKLGNLDSKSKPTNLLFKDIFSMDDSVLFPLTNSVLKYAPDASLVNVPVYNKKGELLGKFASKYVYEKTGGLQGRRSYSLVYFQYVDKNNQNQTSGGAGLLLDSFCVKWGDIKDRTGFTLEAAPEQSTEQSWDQARYALLIISVCFPKAVS